MAAIVVAPNGDEESGFAWKSRHFNL